MLADHLTLGDRGPVAVEDPEDGGQRRARCDATAHEHVAVADVCPARLATHNRRVCTHASRRVVSLVTPPSIGQRSIVTSVSVCLSVCVRLSAVISSELHVRSSPNFCACYIWPWLGLPLAA